MDKENQALRKALIDREEPIGKDCPCPPFLTPDRKETLRKFVTLEQKSVQLHNPLLALMFEEKTTQPMINHVCYHLEVASWAIDAARHQVMRCVQDTRRLWEKEAPDPGSLR